MLFSLKWSIWHGLIPSFNNNKNNNKKKSTIPYRKNKNLVFVYCILPRVFVFSILFRLIHDFGSKFYCTWIIFSFYLLSNYKHKSYENTNMHLFSFRSLFFSSLNPSYSVTFTHIHNYKHNRVFLIPSSSLFDIRS